MVLLAGEDGLFQIIFLLLMLLGWGIKTAAEERQRRRKRGEMAEQASAPSAEVEAPDVVLSPPPPSSGRPAPHRPARRAARRLVPAPTGVGATHLGATAERHLDELHTQLEKRLARRGRAARAPHLMAHAGARSRLLGPTGRLTRAHVRAGILWSEVLGPPRALRGPHRPPALDRMGARRKR